jgi:transcriptional regulator with XRE-family HTH domain
VLTSNQQSCTLKLGKTMRFGERIRELRKEKGMTLREVAERAGIDFTYLSKIETGGIPYTPAVKTIRQLAEALKVDSIDLLTLADKLPKELEPLRTNQHARRFFDRAAKVASPGDWAAFLDLLEERQAKRGNKKASEKKDE